MRTETISLCTHPLSTEAGLFIVSYDNDKSILCISQEALHELLADTSYKDAIGLRVYLASLEDMTSDDITMVVAHDLMGDAACWDDFRASYRAENGFVAYWFDEISDIRGSYRFSTELAKREEAKRGRDAAMARLERSAAASVRVAA